MTPPPATKCFAPYLHYLKISEAMHETVCLKYVSYISISLKKQGNYFWRKYLQYSRYTAGRIVSVFRNCIVFMFISPPILVENISQWYNFEA
jgi:cytochrome c oxidase subunit IV